MEKEVKQVDNKTKKKSILSILGLVISYELFALFYNAEIKLCRDYFPNQDIEIKKTPLSIPEYKIDYDKNDKRTFRDEISGFIKVITTKFDKEDLKIFYKNINTLRLNDNTIGSISKYLKGKKSSYYEITHNYIEVNPNYIFHIYHELFHMASSIAKDNMEYCGFSQISKEYSIGTGLNEGYTEVLTERYFPYETRYLYAYRYEMEVALAVENLIGQDIMEKLYLNSDLKGLVKELEKYAKIDEIIKFITRVDFLTKHLNKYILLPNEYSMNKKALKDVYTFLLKAYTIKTLNQLSVDIKDKEKNDEYLKELINYQDSLMVSLSSCGHTYDFMTPEEAEELICKYLNDGIKIDKVK